MSRSRARIRTLGLLSVLAVGTASLSGCNPFGGGGGSITSRAVDFEGAQSATIQIEAQGTFTPPGEGAAYETAGHGSGFLISRDGLAITNNHVVAGAGVLEVWVGGDTSETLNARILGTSECLDLALIDVDGSDLPFFAFESTTAKTAQEVYAAGFPLGDPEFTMTRGIVSKTSANGESDWASLDSVIEHDARIRGGNSGGPLLTAEGTVLGVNYAGNDELDLNFAIPSEVVEEILPQLREGGNPESLGVNAVALAPSEDGLALGVWVISVASGSAANKIGILPGDILQSMEGVTLAAQGTLSEYCDVLRTKGADSVIAVELYRPSDEAMYEGQFNGDPLVARTVPSAGDDEEPTTSTEDFTVVTSDTGTIEVEVPARWSDVRDTPIESDSGDTWDRVSASSDLDGYFDSWGVGGMDLLASEAAASSYTAEALLEEFGAPGACTLDNTDDYSDALYTGAFDYYTDCGGTESRFVVVALAADDGSHMVVLRAELASAADEAALQTMLSTFVAGF